MRAKEATGVFERVAAVQQWGANIGEGVVVGVDGRVAEGVKFVHREKHDEWCKQDLSFHFSDQ